MRDRRDDAAVRSGRAAPIGDDELDAIFGCCRGHGALLLAVSGGADSLALMHLALDWAKRIASGAARPRLSVATVDHGLRPQSLDEAVRVGEHSRALGLDHAILQWTGIKPVTGVQAAARSARYRLLAHEARRTGAGAVLTAHTRDDQAETLLMRLARGSSVDGLAGMRPVSRLDGIALLRPLLDIPRARLVASLVARGVAWIDDPSNDDERFERVRLRRAGDARAKLGLEDAHLALTARRLDRVRAALDRYCGEFIAAHAQLNDGAFCRIDAGAFREIPDEIALRVLTRVLAAFGGRAEMPSLARIERLAEALGTTRAAATLGGCRFSIDARALLVTREPGRRGLEEIHIARGAPVVWDRRFVVTGTNEAEEGGRPWRVRALGPDGVRQLRAVLNPEKRRRADTTLANPFAEWPPQAMTTLPSVWRGDELCAVPHGGGLLAARGLLSRQGAFRADFLGAQALGQRPEDVMLG